ncbi:DinB family protein [Flavobacterium enshiense]|uniref:DinB family protein n=1 Tax=Flavobacterium enshiense TaxID=1341165 RepID=UPI00345D9628
MEKTELMVEMALKSWKIQVKRAEHLLNSLTNNELLNEVAPGRNRGIYLFGHLAAYHDLLSETLGSGKKDFPEMQSRFVENPDDKESELLSIIELKSFWKKVHERLENEFQTLTTEDWFSKHEAVSQEDFKKEPHRNKLNVLLNRTSHLTYHLGQLMLLKK